MSKARIAAATGGLVLAGASILGYIGQWEGRDLTVRADALAYGVPTVCGGHTDWSLKVGQAYTKADCDKIDQKTAEKYGLAVLNCATVPLNQNQFDALTLFAVNVGIAGACDSRAMRLMNAGQPEAACKAITHGPVGSKPPKQCQNSAECMRIARGPLGPPAWSYSGGTYRRGLANRRAFERDLCLKPVNTERSSA